MRGKGIPEKFLERLTEMFDVSLFNQVKQTFVERPTTFRVNTIKAKKDEVLEILNQNGFKFERVQWYKDAFVLKNKTKRELTDLDIYKEGKIYIQSLASMIPPLALDPQPGEKVLDLTAAPGSKTSQIAAFMNNTGELVANDNNKIRFFKLKHNMEVLGVANTPRPDGHPSQEGNQTIPPSRGDEGGVGGWYFTLRMEHGSALCKEYPEYFDKILLDAPCSAEARFVAGEPKTYGYWKEQKIKEMAYKQRQLLFAAWGALKSGGILVYSTCTFAPEENELQITRFLESLACPSPLLRRQAGYKGEVGEGVCQAEILEIDLKDIKRLSIVKTWRNKNINKDIIKKALRIMPTKEIEGFFVVKMKKIC